MPLSFPLFSRDWNAKHEHDMMWNIIILVLKAFFDGFDVLLSVIFHFGSERILIFLLSCRFSFVFRFSFIQRRRRVWLQEKMNMIMVDRYFFVRFSLLLISLLVFLLFGFSFSNSIKTSGSRVIAAFSFRGTDCQTEVTSSSDDTRLLEEWRMLSKFFHLSGYDAADLSSRWSQHTLGKKEDELFN